MAPQRDVYARLASEHLPWMSDDQRRRMQDIADRLGRGLTKSTPIARTGVMAVNRSGDAGKFSSSYLSMSLMAMVFLPDPPLTTGYLASTFIGIPGGGWQFGFSIFCILLVVYWWCCFMVAP
ncbi:hypothetical protein ACVXHA_13300 [Escherichia coli]